MTTEEIAAHLTERVLPEFVDCYILIAQTAGTKQPLIRAVCKNKEQAERIDSIMWAILKSGGVPYDG